MNPQFTEKSGLSFDLVVLVRLCYSASIYSNDPKTKVGADYIVNGESVVDGYNHLPEGEIALEDKSNFVHAEIDMLNKLEGDLGSGTMYITKAPCYGCAKALVARGLKRVVYTKTYPESDWLASQMKARELFDVHGVEVKEV